ncbi:MAG: homoserine dehydrogenase [Dehalococcoidales bacterium]|nr:homoserine dehydrogenase [Dehalococcoidales bacterium]
MGKKSIGVGLMGFGVIGSQVGRVLLNRAAHISEQAGSMVVLRKIKVIEPDLGTPKTDGIDPVLFTIDENEFFNTPDMDIVIEVIGGEKPARSYNERAIKAGKHVVTANKELIAKYGSELMELAKIHNVSLNYEAAVGGGIPLIAPLQKDLVANNIEGIYAIINGTTNYILTRMSSEDIDFAPVLAEAQKLGYAEANPSNDIEGIDAAYKLAIMASLTMEIRVRPEDIYCEGISKLESRDFRYASELGYAIKLLAIARHSNGSVEVHVYPAFVPEGSFLAKVDGVYNAVLVEGDLVGKVTFWGEGAGAKPTSSAVVANVIQAARKIACGDTSHSYWKIKPGKKIKPMSEITTRYYIRMTINDMPGALAGIAGVFGNCGISISAALQKEDNLEEKSAEIVIMTHPSKEEAVQAALKELNNLSVVKTINNFIRVEE